ECCAPWRGTDCRPTALRQRASRPQPKRDPLGSGGGHERPMNSNSACCASLLEVLCTTLALSCANRPKPQLALSPAAPASLITCGVVEARSAGFEPSRFGLVREQRPDSSSDLDALWLTVARADSGASLPLHIKAAG